MIFDTDVVIWALGGRPSAAALINRTEQRELSVVSYMELIRGARGRQELRAVESFLAQLDFLLLPLTENIGHRASVYVEEYALKSSLGVPDALIAATAIENNRILCTGNAKHYRVIGDLQLQAFRP